MRNLNTQTVSSHDTTLFTSAKEQVKVGMTKYPELAVCEEMSHDIHEQYLELIGVLAGKSLSVEECFELRSILDVDVETFNKKPLDERLIVKCVFYGLSKAMLKVLG